MRFFSQKIPHRWGNKERLARNGDIVAKHEAGWSFRRLAALYEISPGRVRQIYERQLERMDRAGYR